MNKPATQRMSPTPEGWVRIGQRNTAYWHWRGPDQVVICMKTRGPQTSIIEWRDEPGGRHEACQDCRRRRDQELRARCAPEPEPTPEPELLTLPAPEPLPEPAPDVVPAEPVEPVPVLTITQEQPVAKPLAMPVPTTPTTPKDKRWKKPTNHSGGFLTASQMATQHGLSTWGVINWLKNNRPSTPRLGTGQKAKWLLDQEAQKAVIDGFGKRKDAAKANAKASPDFAALVKDMRAIRGIVEAIARELKIEAAV